MHSPEDPSPESHDGQIAELLATGFLRLHSRSLAHDTGCLTSPKSPEFSPQGLEVPLSAVLSVSTG